MRLGAEMAWRRWTWTWKWLTLGCVLVAASAGKRKNAVSICDMDPCACSRGRLVCDCSASSVKDVSLTADVLDRQAFSSISVTQCSQLQVGSRALAGLAALRRFAVDRVVYLELAEHALYWAPGEDHGLVVNISHSAIPQLPSYCFNGALGQIHLVSVNISNVQAFAFGGILHAEKIVIDGARIDHIESQAFKKFGVDFFTVKNVRVPVLQKRTITNVEIHQEAQLKNLQVDRIETGAIVLPESRNLRIVQSRIGHVEHHAFQVKTKGDVSIHDNVFGFVESDAFAGISLEERYYRLAGKQELVFENNTLVDFQSAGLTFNTSGLNPIIDWIIIGQQCSCDSVKTLMSDLVYYSSYSSSKLSPQVSSIVFCSNGKPTSLKDYLRVHCDTTMSTLLVILVVIAVLAAVAIGVVVFCRMQKKGKRYIGVATCPQKTRGPNKKNILVLPDGKTYQETELHVIVERAEAIVPTEYVHGLSGEGEAAAPDGERPPPSTEPLVK